MEKGKTDSHLLIYYQVVNLKKKILFLIYFILSIKKYS